MKNLIYAALITIGPMAFGHGEDKPGPHGGFIRMPGAYHTELVPVQANSVKVYLLDIHWKNPLVKDSQVELTLNSQPPLKASCQPQKDHFLCAFDKTVDLKKPGQLVVVSKRQDMKGSDMTYELPLKTLQPVKPTDPHHGH